MSTDAEREEIERMRRRAARMQRMRLEKEKAIRTQRLVKKLAPFVLTAVLLLGVALGVIVRGAAVPGREQEQIAQTSDERNAMNTVKAASTNTSVDNGSSLTEEAQDTDGEYVVPTEDEDNTKAVKISVSTKQYFASETDRTSAPPGEVDSTNVIFLERESGNILAQRDCHTVINPASMTKVLTVLVAAEHITEADLDDKFTITAEITDYSFIHDCSNVGFEKGEQVTVRDMFYGTILPSGADAAVGLATYVAGSHEAFVDLMNEKLEILGLSDTAHFTNCVGIYDKDHHCTVYDMAMIMEAALDNELCREVLSAHTYTTSATSEHPEGLLISNWFLRRIEDQDTGGEVVCGKTGFVDQSGNCCVSFGVDPAGNEYICATTGAHGSWRCIYDHTALYKKYAKEKVD